MFEGTIKRLQDWYSSADKRMLFSVSLVLLIASCGFLYYNMGRTRGAKEEGEWFLKGLTLRGGNQLTAEIPVDLEVDVRKVEDLFAEEGIESRVRAARSATERRVEVRTGTDTTEEKILEVLGKEGIEVKDHSFNTVDPALAEGFWEQSRLALIAAFFFMGIVVLFVFRDFVPFVAILYAVTMDMIVVITMMQVFQIPLTLASFAGLLLVIGYSVDSDVVLVTRILKRREGTVTERAFSAMKTSMAMMLTTLSALVVLYLTTTAKALREIAAVLIIALLIDFVSTWFGNASVIRWWVER
ncbi:MAG: hypothetical protein ACLFM9_00645 [Candidatus Aenigmatarchaeota archaeon]